MVKISCLFFVNFVFFVVKLHPIENCWNFFDNYFKIY